MSSELIMSMLLGFGLTVVLGSACFCLGVWVAAREHMLQRHAEWDAQEQVSRELAQLWRG